MRVIKQISSLEKIRIGDKLNMPELTNTKVLKGERYSYQIAIVSDVSLVGKFEIESPLLPYIRTYAVNQSVMDNPTTIAVREIDLITDEPGLMPDLLTPLSEQNNIIQARSYYGKVASNPQTVWIEVNLPKDIAKGSYPITSRLIQEDGTILFEKTMTLTVLDGCIEEQTLLYTRWFYVDCISNYHGVEIYSDEHFALIEAYLREAVDVGINMILVPIHTPPLDTAVGTTRPCVQLVDIKKEGDTYTFGFEKLRRFVAICKRAGIKYYEMAHMFSQWGAKFAANIMVEENGVKSYLFGWNVAATDPRYQDFLRQYVAAVYGEMKALGVADHTYFHISDEPNINNIEAYQAAAEIIKPLIGESKTFDALSKYEFYEKGLVECPVTCISHIDEFLKHDIPNQWAYYCCDPQSIYTNSFMAMTSHRTRILGVLLYKFDIKGFLHWGLNFYNSALSLSEINPYVTSAAGGSYPSGDAFILYPSKTGAYPSIRGKITYEAIGDLNLCRTLEKYIGRDAVVKMIDEVAGGDVRFDDYPRDSAYLPALRAKMLDEIEKHLS